MHPLLALPAPTVPRVLSGWEPGPAVALAVLGAAAYLGGVRRLARRGRRWPRARTVAFLAGLAVVAFAAESGLAAYGDVLFSLHVVQHLLLGMAGPLLLALGGPVTLALQASGRPTQRRLVAALRSLPVAVVTHPVTAWLAFGAGLVALYFTALFEVSLRHEWAHMLVHLHFLVAGCLFAWHVVGIDPLRGALGYGARLLYVLVALPFHAFLGVALLTSDRLLADGWYGRVVREWGSSPLADQRTGAGILWAAGEVFGLVAAGIVLYQWMTHEQRAAARHDRRLDATAALATMRAGVQPSPSERSTATWKSGSASSTPPRSSRSSSTARRRTP